MGCMPVKSPCSHGGRRNGNVAVRRAVIDDPVYVEEEKELVLDDGPADGGAKLVVPQIRHLRRYVRNFRARGVQGVWINLGA